ncbi:aspartyl-phosphate phosphatase Spo0E family protein [Sporolactobacillus vineae]|uniref:aspartyl-phosphate phosphatase Spo0E family protein n=1 Tax=Sporolactobacillus vineae TaxID=444463 RepID=UPI00028A1E5E|nr:aspartyl-phosphate phosphatase Spo0E family protein [Sporolactobacillus vineae]
MNKQQLIEKIEYVRRQLVLAAEHESLSSNRMQRISRCLDSLLNKYERMVGRSWKPTNRSVL